MDPYSGKYPWQSPYLVFNSNPNLFSDPLGLEGVDPNKNTVGAPERSYESLSGKKWHKVSAGQAAGAKKGDGSFTSSVDEKTRLSYYFIPNATTVEARDDNGALVPNENGIGYKYVPAGFYVAVLEDYLTVTETKTITTEAVYSEPVTIPESNRRILISTKYHEEPDQPVNTIEGEPRDRVLSTLFSSVYLDNEVFSVGIKKTGDPNTINDDIRVSLKFRYTTSNMYSNFVIDYYRNNSKIKIKDITYGYMSPLFNNPASKSYCSSLTYRQRIYRINNTPATVIPPKLIVPATTRVETNTYSGWRER